MHHEALHKEVEEVLKILNHCNDADFKVVFKDDTCTITCKVCGTIVRVISFI